MPSAFLAPFVFRPMLALSLDSRRLAMLKAMGTDAWWLKPPAAVAELAAAPEAKPAAVQAAVASPAGARQAPPLMQPQASERAQARPSPAKPLPPAPSARAAHAPASSPAARQRASAPAPAVVPALAPLGLLAASPWLRPDALAAAPAASSPSYLLVVDDLSALGQEQETAQRLLHNMLHAMGLAQSPAVWWSQARRLAQGEQATPIEALLSQCQPRVLIALGRDAAQAVLGDERPLGVLRRTEHRMAHAPTVPVVVTYSPAYLLRAAHAKRGAWEDLQRALQLAAA